MELTWELDEAAVVCVEHLESLLDLLAAEVGLQVPRERLDLAQVQPAAAAHVIEHRLRFNLRRRHMSFSTTRISMLSVTVRAYMLLVSYCHTVQTKVFDGRSQAAHIDGLSWHPRLELATLELANWRAA